MSAVRVLDGGRDLGWNPTLRDVQTIVDTVCRWHQTHPKGYSSAE